MTCQGRFRVRVRVRVRVRMRVSFRFRFRCRTDRTGFSAGCQEPYGAAYTITPSRGDAAIHQPE